MEAKHIDTLRKLIKSNQDENITQALSLIDSIFNIYK